MAKKKVTKGSAKKTTSKQLKAQSKIDPIKALLIVLAVALVGGSLVYISNASTLSSYNKSVVECNNIKTSSTLTKKQWTDCANSSAEALTYRYYRGLLGRQPDRSGFVFWTNALVKGKENPERIAQRMIASTEGTYGTLSNEQFVARLYNTIKGKPGDTKGVEYWTKKLTSGTKRARVIELFAAEAKVPYATALKKMSQDVLTNKQFVDKLYDYMMEADKATITVYPAPAPASAKDRAYWVAKLDSTDPKVKLTRQAVAAKLAQTITAKNANSSEFLNYVQSLKLYPLAIPPK